MKLWKIYFTCESIALTAGMAVFFTNNYFTEYIKSLFSVNFSKRESNLRAVEEQTTLIILITRCPFDINVLVWDHHSIQYNELYRKRSSQYF